MMKMQIKAIYEDKVFKPLKDPHLPDKANVRIIIKRSFSDLLDELGELKANRNIDSLLENMKTRNYDR
jgi:predicted DNA-binding antitoxin AbrB/MazE fold protein